MTTDRRGFSRRRFLGGTAAAAGGLTAGALGAGALTGGLAGTTAAGAAPFHGAHQAGILNQPMRNGILLALDVVAPDRAGLTGLFQELTGQLRSLAGGGPSTEAFNAGIAGDNGILGPDIPAGQLTATVGVGSSLFDGRFGLAARKPKGLVPMKTFPNDNLDPSRCHGDLSVLLQADDTDTVVHAMRRVLQATDGAVQPKWRVDGFVNPPRPSGLPRNLFGFNDGVSNPDTTAAATMDDLVWLDDAEQPWAAGGSYQVVRVIRQLVEFWDRVSVQEQETMIGRRRDTGAPLGANNVNATPDFASDPQGVTMPLTAHLRMANPRTKATDNQRILRRAMNYDRGLDLNGNLDQGLVFLAYQQDVHRQFEAIQTRLIDEPMVDYISPVGGGYFLVLPGIRDGSDWYGRSLLT